MAKPGVTGKDLVELGFRPGPEFSEALGFAHKLQLAGVEKEEALKGFLKNTLSWERVAGRRRDGGGAVPGWTGGRPSSPAGRLPSPAGEGGPGAARDGCGGDT